MTAGLNELFRLGVFHVVDAAGNKKAVEDKKNEKFLAREVGGAVDSDVQVLN